MARRVRIYVDSIRSRIEDCPYDISSFLYKKLRYKVEGCEYVDSYLDGRWDGYKKLFSYKTSSFSSGLLQRVLFLLKKKKVEYEVIDNRVPVEWNKAEVVRNMEDFGVELRDYQIDGLIKGLSNPYMIFWWATSSGKTVLFSALITALKRNGKFRKTLILVSNIDLAAQHREELEFLTGSKIGVVEEGRFEPQEITVAVINTLWIKACKKPVNEEVREYLSTVQYLISDECHHITDSKMFKNTISLCKNTFARHGFSGSPFSLTNNDMELEAVTGPPVSRVSLSDLIRDGWVSRPEINLIRYDSEWVMYRYQKAYRLKIVENKVRNDIIADIVCDEFKQNKIILIIVRIIKHGNILKRLFEERGIDSADIKYVHGSSSDSQRKKVKEEMKRGNARIVISSYIWNEGIDIPAIDVLVKADAGGGKEIQDNKGLRIVIQQIGRVVRKPVLLKKSDVDCEKENIVKVYDFIDMVQKDLANHSRNREATYRMEKEFIIRKGTYEDLRSKK